MEDTYLWLEKVEGAEALAWVEERNTETLTLFEADPRFQSLRDDALAILEDDDKVPWGAIRGRLVYNFWQDANHVRGLWRRCQRSRYGTVDPGWETVIDLDALSEADDENWVWRGATVAADGKRAMVALSRGGKDAAVIREFDLDQLRFVAVEDGGFALAEAKSSVAWVDENTLLVGTDVGPDALTESGYPAQVRRWSRGTELETAELVHRVDPGYVAVSPGSVNRPEGDYLYLAASPDFFTEEVLLFDGDQLRLLPLPPDIDFRGFFNRRALGILRSSWRGYDQGSLIAVNLDDDGADDVTVVYAPDERSSVASVAASARAVVVITLEDVTSTLYLATFDDQGSGWVLNRADLPDLGSIELISAPDDDTEVFVAYNDFLTPPSLVAVDTVTATVTTLARQAARFDTTGLTVNQHFATSADGTRVPYFHIGPAEIPADGSGRVIMYGYGGFEIALTPGYRAVMGKSWLEPGNQYVIANIRGGGEYGPRWHQAALKTNRDKAYEDFEAVAADLIARKVTKPAHLGIEGGSNGGLLVGSAVTRNPELYGAVFCAVPLLDMLRFHLLLAGASWTGEYGNPEEPEIAEFWAGRSPFHRVSAEADYPEIFFYTSTRDDRVHPAHARKMVARMTDLGHRVFYYENTEGGHAAGANLKQTARLEALKYVYFNRTL